MNEARILLADDHAVVRAGISKALADLLDVKVVGEVGDGPAVFSALAQLQPDMLLLDVAMPDFDALQGVRQIRSAYPQLKILVVSAHADDAYVVGLLEAGVNGYHLKDHPLSDLRLAVQRVLAGERWISGPLVDKLVRRQMQAAMAPRLTPRQRDLLYLLQQGCDNSAIARTMQLSVKTIENHLTRLYRLLGVSSRLEAVSYAAAHPEVLVVAGEDAAEADAPETAGAGALRVLLVDDNPRYRAQLRHMVGKVCRESLISEAGSVSEALDQADRHNIHLALVDVVLGDGQENDINCTRRLRALSPQTRVVLISAYPDREFHRQGLQAGAVAFLDKKDLNAETLRPIIEDVSAAYARPFGFCAVT